MRILPALSLIGLSWLAGCSKQPDPSSVVPIGEVPEDIKKIAQDKLPDIKFDTAWKIKVGGEDAYELRGKNQRGRVREVEVSASGKILEVE
ncbi:MAG TPA: hypothetical protein VN699_04280 [Pirellulales bacterium]|nr:hypothetical protein [Pirellulales bacterium]